MYLNFKAILVNKKDSNVKRSLSVRATTWATACYKVWLKMIANNYEKDYEFKALIATGGNLKGGDKK